MELDETDIREFKELWAEEFKETLSDEVAREYASNLMSLFAALAEPFPSKVRRGEPKSPHDQIP